MREHPTDTPVMVAYRQWQAVHTALETCRPEDEAGLSAEVATRADRILDLPSITALDVLAKISAQTLAGACGLDACPRGGEVLAEAVAMVGAG